jgi:hypothetical protein
MKKIILTLALLGSFVALEAQNIDYVDESLTEQLPEQLEGVEEEVQ